MKSFVNKLFQLKKAEVSAKKNSSGFLFEGYLAQRELWPYFLGCTGSDILVSLERLHCTLGRITFNLLKEWFTIRFYYKLAIFKCMHKAYNGRLPSTLINCIVKKRDLSYSIRVCASLLVPRFKTRFIKDSIAYSGTVLSNMLSSKYTDLADTSQCNLAKKAQTFRSF